MKEYIRKNWIPVLWEGLFVGSYFFIPKRYVIYTNFIFYLGIVAYFAVIGEVSLKKWRQNLRSGGKFRKAAVITLLGFMVVFAVSVALESFFPHVPTGMIGLRRDNWLTLAVFAISTILLPPIAEEAFYRGSMIVTDQGKGVLLITAGLSMLLYALEHAVAPFGILLSVIIAIPMTVAYIKTKNIYVVMTAHFIANLLGNGVDIVLTAFHLMTR